MAYFKLIIPNQKNIYTMKYTLFSLGLKFDSKKQLYYNPFDLEISDKTKIFELLKEHDFEYRYEEISSMDFLQEIEYLYKINTLDETNLFIEKRSDRKNLFYINLTDSKINIVDLINSKFLTSFIEIKEYEDINLPMFALKVLNSKEHEFSELLKILSVLIDFNSEEFRFESRLNAFKFHVFGIIKEKGADNFLCNCVDGFFPETNFFVNGTRIYSDYLKQNISYEQEKKILKYLFLNRDFIGAKKVPTFKDLFIGKKITVMDCSGNPQEVVISYVTYNRDSKKLKIKLYNGICTKEANREFYKEELLSYIQASR